MPELRNRDKSEGDDGGLSSQDGTAERGRGTDAERPRGLKRAVLSVRRVLCMLRGDTEGCRTVCLHGSEVCRPPGQTGNPFSRGL